MSSLAPPLCPGQGRRAGTLHEDLDLGGTGRLAARVAYPYSSLWSEVLLGVTFAPGCWGQTNITAFTSRSGVWDAVKDEMGDF